MQVSEKPFRLKVPLYMWILWIIAVLGTFGFVVGTALVAYHFDDWMYGLLVMPFWIFGLVGISIGLAADMKLHSLEVCDDGLKKVANGSSSVWAWNDITRYEPSKRGFTLFFKDGWKLKVPFYVSDFEFFKQFCLAKLEEIGKFEDGRKVPRVILALKWVKIWRRS